MKDKSLVYISKKYVYRKKYERILLKFSSIYDLVFSKISTQLSKELKQVGLKFNLIASDQVYNFIRENTSLVTIFYDLEDIYAQELIKYCTEHCIPFLIVNNPLDDEDI